VVETRRGHTLGRLFWRGGPEPDTGLPDGDSKRVLRSPADGGFDSRVNIGEHVELGQLIAEIAGVEVRSPLAGIVRGLIHPGLPVTRGLKIGDVDPRDDPRLCQLVSDKALAIGGGVLEAITSRVEVRAQLWT
jgi:xanthine dehydrogenase accessory factor